MSPALLLIFNALTLGLRSAFWVVNRMSSLQMMAKPEEKNINASIVIWITSFCAHLTLLALTAYNAATQRLGFEYLAESRVIRVCAAAYVLSFIVNRFILFWSREVIIDELRTNELDVIRSRALTFAPSPMLIWFIGVPYIQAHINRMIKKKGLNAYKPSKGLRVKKRQPRREEVKKITPELASGHLSA
jgi:hypothetical protein